MGDTPAGRDEFQRTGEVAFSPGPYSFDSTTGRPAALRASQSAAAVASLIERRWLCSLACTREALDGFQFAAGTVFSAEQHSQRLPDGILPAPGAFQFQTAMAISAAIRSPWGDTLQAQDAFHFGIDSPISP